jgi:hypothetical protein
MVPGSDAVRTKIAARLTERAFRELAGVGLARISQMRHVPALRGVWPGAQPPLDERSAPACGPLEVLPSGGLLAGLARLADVAGVDLRDLESGLVRLALGHGRAMASCPGGQDCAAVRARR